MVAVHMLVLCAVFLLSAHSARAVCAPGYGNETGLCVQCAAGRYSLFGSVCAVCPVGSFSPVAGMAVCVSCGPGTITTTRSTRCEPCAAGTYQADGTHGSCTACPPGKVAHEPGMTTCVSCTAGTYSNEKRAGVGPPSDARDGGTECTACPWGRWSDAEWYKCDECPYVLNGTADAMNRICALSSNATIDAHRAECRRIELREGMSSDMAAVGTVAVALVFSAIYWARVLRMK